MNSNVGVKEAVPSSVGAAELAQILLRRIDTLVLLEKTEGQSQHPSRRASCERTIERARSAALGGDSRAISPALAEIDLLSLELCDD
jgi:hypothetical protein